MSELVRYELRDGVAQITMDDGKANVMSSAMLQALHAAFDRAAADDAVVILRSGRDGVFSAGFDLKVLSARDPESTVAMVRSGAELALKVFSHPAPVITVCAGHAYPMGAFLVLASDIRICAEGPHKIGFNEVAIGIAIPSFALALARQRLAPAWLDRSVVIGEMHPFAHAVQFGFFDTAAAPAALDGAVSQALAAALQVHRPSHAVVKQRLRAPTVQAMREAIDAELTLEAYRRRGDPRRQAEITAEHDR